MEEQKPFEIREEFTIGFGNIKVTEMAVNGYHIAADMCKQLAQYVMEANDEIRRLQQQLAGAPTWGEWVDATVEAHRSGAYDVEFEDGSSELHTRSDLQYMLKWPPVENSVKRFRRLNYEPKPAREVERTYEGLTAREWADGSGGPVASGLARDLLAAQAELRELKGEK